MRKKYNKDYSSTDDSDSDLDMTKGTIRIECRSQGLELICFTGTLIFCVGLITIMTIHQDSIVPTNPSNQISLTHSSNTPSISPSTILSLIPSVHPTNFPSSTPSTYHSAYPSAYPSSFPSKMASEKPSSTLSSKPSQEPTSLLSQMPSLFPTVISSVAPSLSIQPTTSLTPSSFPTQTPTHESFLPEATAFYAMGDIPYSTNEAKLLLNQMSDLSPDGVDFMVHVGDMTKASGSLGCSPEWFEMVDRVMSFSPVPIFPVIGDNDVADCDNPSQALQYWKLTFLKYHEKYWDHTFHVRYQKEREENMAFYHKGILYIFVHIIGTPKYYNTGNDEKDRLMEEEWKERHSDNWKWTKHNIEKYLAEPASLRTSTKKNKYNARGVVVLGHARPRTIHNDYFNPLEDIADKYENIPFIYIHGDGHTFDKSNLSKKIQSIQVEQGANEEPLRIDVNPFSSSLLVQRTNNNNRSNAFQTQRFRSTKTSIRKYEKKQNQNGKNKNKNKN